jgi:hypothetical protein
LLVAGRFCGAIDNGQCQQPATSSGVAAVQIAEPELARNATTLELGLDTPGDVTAGPDGVRCHMPQYPKRHRQGVLADRVGADFLVL